jgi:uncharacterized protein
MDMVGNMNHKLILIITALLITVQGYSQREFTMKDGDRDITMKRYVFMMLEAGQNRQQDSLQVSELQKGHMAHLKNLAETGKLVMAGPFEEGGKYRGLLIFDVDSISEAEELEQDDPAVKAGRLQMNTFYWWTEKGRTLN